MSEHVTAESLSAYLDDEVRAPEAQRLKDHLAGCESCRRRLDGMRRVVAGLRRVERLEPPRLLDHAVARRVALERDRVGWSELLESRLEVLTRQPTTFAIFAMVLALAALVYAFAVVLDPERRATAPVVFEGGASLTVHTAGDRVLHLTAGGWIEEGADPKAVERTVHWGSPAVAELLAAHPDIEDLESLGKPVIVKVDGRVLRLVRPAERAP